MKQVGIGTRVLNFIVDLLLIFALSFAANKAWNFYVYYWNITFFPFYVFFWLVMFLYYFIFEAIFKRTPGKWLTMTKVVTDKNTKPSVIQIFFRSLIRLLIIIDWLAFPFLNENALHDYLTKTKVVEK